ncbi:gamma-aminobutyrate permease-like transporter [Corynebacterium kutscheri]|uniref:Gamma-aminobutyrate permease-like transporter n=1 Tax=Corynebacterium kutscheri TaxID=35755 RepID=A0A0F6TDL6_9CORY|nr:amino acid permease [Corynebacterium kutscheri]AKE41719.1 gamma-aminobutyrate permease-like transporter [Corynebacterium kutscheri]VEH10046.1 aromatic amino acid transporter [Corynebacterium kutscheri]
MSENNLSHGLKTRHLTMMGLGSAIGAGLFLGTGVGIQVAGPAVLIAYIIAGALIVCVMQMLGELAAARPSSGSFAEYARQAFGHWAGFSLGWLYWFMLTMVLGAEMTGAAAIIGAWFNVAPWIPALICVIIFAVINLAQVEGFGEFEFWFAFIKVAVIIGFLIIGVLLIFGLLPGHSYIGTDIFASSDFMPNGIAGVAAGLLAVAFAFGGIEIVTIAAAESRDPKTAIATAVRSVIWRISFFYIGSVLIICFLLPYSQISGAESAAESPFTMVLSQANIPGVVGFMELVIVLSLLSAFNAQIYATSRMVHNFAQRGDAPKIFSMTNVSGVPIFAVLLSMVFAFASVGLQYWNPPGLLTFLLNAVGGCLIVLWLIVTLAHIKLRPELKQNNELATIRMWGYPWLSWLTFLGLVALTILMLFDPSSRQQIFAVSAMFVGLIVVSFFVKKPQVG